ncbi:hypothetical protein Dimus_001523 [Dionaea muscipula]
MLAAAGLVGIYGYTAYSASKFGLRGLAEALQQEVIADDIHVSLIFPPDTETPGLAEENKRRPQLASIIAASSGVILDGICRSGCSQYTSPWWTMFPTELVWQYREVALTEETVTAVSDSKQVNFDSSSEESGAWCPEIRNTCHLCKLVDLGCDLQSVNLHRVRSDRVFSISAASGFRSAHHGYLSSLAYSAHQNSSRNQVTEGQR